MTAPDWMQKYPCEGCGTGYGMCAQGAVHSMMCCKDCKHESPRVWTDAELLEMWEGREGWVPDRVRELRKARA